VVKIEEIRHSIAENGFVVISKNDRVLLNDLREIYETTHQQHPANGGMFYSVYSQDREYRRLVNEKLGESLKPLLDEIFRDYKTVINSFIIKHPGPKSEFYLHQDSTGLNEWKYSPLSMWMPLQDTTIENGCMWVVPKSHRWFSPYRGISFQSMFDEHRDLLKPYLSPIEMKAGEILFFDNRLAHLSGSNKGIKPRVVVMSGIFPKEADLISVYRDEKVDGPIEIYAQDESYLTENLNFYIDCTARPRTGKKIAECLKGKLKLLDSELKEILENKGEISKIQYEASLTEVACDIIQEPK
jgi:hypothetical protein